MSAVPTQVEHSPPSKTAQWTIADAAELYNMEGWGLGYFGINAAGHVVVHPDGDPARGVDLHQIALDMSEQGVGLPLLLRFSDMLRSRIEELAGDFASAIAEFGYTGSYATVYPIKVNQQRHVVQEILEFGIPHGVGLECGSKPELMAVLGLSESAGQTIICNGYKDEEFMRLALIGQQLGHKVVIVLEQVGELDVLLKVAGSMSVTPTVGVRIKLSSEGSGRWARSGGEKSKFGLAPVELMQLLDRLRDEGREDLLKLIHFHLGSQITDIRHIKAGLEEVGRFYIELRGMGFDIETIDVGGGLGVDYDGTRSIGTASMNYTMREYANDVVYTIGGMCRNAELPMPDLISESGRAITAHHAMLLVNVIDCESLQAPDRIELEHDAHRLLVEMRDNLAAVGHDRLEESFHDAVFAKGRSQEYFASGVFSLRERALAEQLYLMTLEALGRELDPDSHDDYPELVAHLESTLVDRYFCNFSLFQSLPDNWAIDQLFPIMPIHRLDEVPTRRGTIQDVTCDSDGVIDHFAGGRDGKPSLELHPWREDEPYILGIFLAGAYQEILGDLHNLFGDTNAVHLRVTPEGYEVTDLVHGDTVTEVLTYVQFQASELLTTFRRKVARATGISRSDANGFIADYVAGLEGYTYLEAGEE